MAFIIGKKQDGKTYYYLAESARVGGKPGSCPSSTSARPRR